MPEKLLLHDIERVQGRIARIRQRAGRHASQITDLPVLSLFTPGNSGYGAKSASAPQQSSGWWGLLIAVVGWYFSQPEAVQNLWHRLLAYWHAWKNPEDSAGEPEAENAEESNES